MHFKVQFKHVQGGCLTERDTGGLFQAGPNTGKRQPTAERCDSEAESI